MKGILCLSALLALATQGYAANLVCYFSSWSVYRNGNGKFVPQNIDPNLCTHVHFAFVGLNTDGSVHILDEWEAINLNGISDLISLKQQNKNLKVILSMGGWNEGTFVFSSVLGNTTLRANFVRNVVAFVQQYGFDGFELSWEYPNGKDGRDSQNFLLTLRDLKANLGNLTLSMAGAGIISEIDGSYDVPNVANVVDMINVMSYDYHGSYDGFVAHASALYPSSLDGVLSSTLNVNSTITHWLERGAPASKLNMGIVTYGRGFTLSDPSQTQLYATTQGPSDAGPYTQEPGMLGYNEICEFDSQWQSIFDPEQAVPHLVNGNQWIGYEDVVSVGEKAKLAKSMNLGGVAVWSLDTDDFNGICGRGKYPLIKEIQSILQ